MPITKTKTERKETEKGHLEKVQRSQVKREYHRAQTSKQTRQLQREDNGTKGKAVPLVWMLYKAETFIFLSVLLAVEEHVMLQLGRQYNRSMNIKNACKAVCQSDGHNKQQHRAVVCVDDTLKSRKLHKVHSLLFH